MDGSNRADGRGSIKRERERARGASGARENIERNCEAKEKAEGQGAEHTKETERWR